MNEFIIYVAFATFLIIRGFKRNLGFATWHMFTKLNRCKFRLTDANGEQFNKWKYLPHTHMAMTENELDFFMYYLREIKHLKLNGEIDIISGFQTKTVTVRDTNVAC